MPKYELLGELLTGVPDIDLQHRQWIRQYNEFAQAAEKGEDFNQILAMLGFLMDYADFHFFCEERKMDQCGYPAAAEHKKQHRQMRDKLSSIIDEYGQGGSTPEVAESILSFLNDWLVGHIGTTDAALGRFLQARPKDRKQA